MMTQQKKRLNLTITGEQYKCLKEIAQYEGETINSLCRRIFREYFEKKERHKWAEEEEVE